MNIIAVDDERLALLVMEQAIMEVVPEAELYCYTSPEEALDHARKKPVDVAFLDIEMDSISGISLALELKQISPTTNIIFVTAHTDYMGYAFSMYASGYVLKPADPARVKLELENLRHPVNPPDEHRLRMQCFGNFEVFLDGRPLSFPRSKSKQLLAYLVDRKGSGVSIPEICAVLWPERDYSISLQKQAQTIIAQMIKTLKDAGLNDLIRKSWNSLSVDTSKFSCDYYELLNGNVAALNKYTGEYMSSYSWAELTAGTLSQKLLK
ncbi:two-component system response regulator [Deltaproteobacteria bacterium Smac51]|nr:two-component system response regulator [Deltaproteobacteria bacterium Smac51]